MHFGGSPACTGTVQISQTPASKAWLYENIVSSGTNSLEYENGLYVRFILSKPRDNYRATYPRSFTYKKGVTYPRFIETELGTTGFCIYSKLKARSSNESSGYQGENPVGENEHPIVVAWAWIGPLTGATAPIAAARLGVYCVRRRNGACAEPSQSVYASHSQSLCTSQHARPTHQPVSPPPVYKPPVTLFINLLLLPLFFNFHTVLSTNTTNM